MKSSSASLLVSDRIDVNVLLHDMQDEEARRHQHLRYVCTCLYVEISEAGMRDLLQPRPSTCQVVSDVDKRSVRKELHGFNFY